MVTFVVLSRQDAWLRSRNPCRCDGEAFIRLLGEAQDNIVDRRKHSIAIRLVACDFRLLHEFETRDWAFFSFVQIVFNAPGLIWSWDFGR